MRIAIFTETFLPKVDGIVNTICHLLNYLAEHGHVSILFAPEGGLQQYAETPIVGLPAYPFPLYPEFKLVPPWVAVQSQLTRFQPDLVLLINPASLGVAGLLAARHADLPIAASYNTDIPGYTEQWGFGYLKELAWTYFRWIHNQADLNFAPSQFTLQSLRSQGFHRVRLWSRGVDAQRFHPSMASMQWREKLSGGYPNAPLLLYVGRLAREKRVDMLRLVLATIPEAHLAIVGDGPARPQLEAQFASTHTVFTGYLKGDDLAHAYASADIFTFPSANETFGNVVLEAMASGLPVVAPNSGGVTDIVQHQKTGFLFLPNNAEDMVQAVQKLVHNPVLRSQMKRNSRSLAEQRSWEVIFDQMLAHFETLRATDQARQPGYP